MSDSDFIDIPIEIQLKNGKVVELKGGFGSEDNNDGIRFWSDDGVYGKIILLDNIKCVVIGDTEFALK